MDSYCRESVGNYCYISGAQYVATFPQPVHNFSFSLNSLSKSEFLSLFHLVVMMNDYESFCEIGKRMVRFSTLLIAAAEKG